ncbi:hypothetical protein BC830DRAFT_15322 [Chytriomyces sp. MP71]|nr:hypothetical protein BC830DRAFT_1166338 [Chytriomyces sp. MP71]KAI8618224.1 hypothetical protein BC830DRAFT_15322 [Chytriomyces sp. MP71]
MKTSILSLACIAATVSASRHAKKYDYKPTTTEDSSYNYQPTTTMDSYHQKPTTTPSSGYTDKCSASAQELIDFLKTCGYDGTSYTSNVMDCVCKSYDDVMSFFDDLSSDCDALFQDATGDFEADRDAEVKAVKKLCGKESYGSKSTPPYGSQSTPSYSKPVTTPAYYKSTSSATYYKPTTTAGYYQPPTTTDDSYYEDYQPTTTDDSYYEKYQPTTTEDSYYKYEATTTKAYGYQEPTTAPSHGYKNSNQYEDDAGSCINGEYECDGALVLQCSYGESGLEWFVLDKCNAGKCGDIGNGTKGCPEEKAKWRKSKGRVHH